MSKPLIVPKKYKSRLDLNQTEKAIKLVKDTFQQQLSAELNLRRVTAPLMVLKGTGINDDLNGTEHKVSFEIKDMRNATAEVVNSLAKWKRMALADYGIAGGYGIYTDMNAIRPDEELSNIHSLYVDQWDWERVISRKERNLEFLKYIVRKIYEVLKRTEYTVHENYNALHPVLPHDITFFHAEELQKMYPDLDPRQRETEAVKKHGAIFVIGIGGELADGKVHDGRAPDYDDWTTPHSHGGRGLNGDILLWHPVLERAFEISSMGIRVDPPTLLRQLAERQLTERQELPFHRLLLAGQLPQTMGGGIGQSRLCMFFLRTAHVGEVACGIWPDAMVQRCALANITLL